MAFRPDLFMPTGKFRSRMDDMIRELKDTPPARGYCSQRHLPAWQPVRLVIACVAYGTARTV
jgi:hypothetical protein